MNTQNLIKRKLARPESITAIRQILETDDGLSRSAIAERVCEHLELLNARGKPQRAGCLKALRELERAGHFLLPTARRCPKHGSPRRLAEPVDPPVDVPDRVGEVKDLVLVQVEKRWTPDLGQPYKCLPRLCRPPLVGEFIVHAIGCPAGQ